MADEHVVLRTYGDELSARMAASALEANGVPAHVSTDNAGGAIPSLSLGFPVRLIVLATDADIAREILDTDAE
ncbi:MAG: DUF2007 domain-containing protein [Gemmatimonadaceae bacterium]